VGAYYVSRYELAVEGRSAGRPLRE
jgi:hypothetical protein